jgi:two-component system NarL family sensor kinase
MRVTDGAGNTWTRPEPLLANVPRPFWWQRSRQVSGVLFAMALAGLAVTFFYRQRERRRDQERLYDLTQRLMTSQEDERRRISRDLHDGLGGLLTGVSLEIQTAERLDDPEKRNAALRRALHSSREALDHVRQISSVLRPMLLDDVGLREAVSSSLIDFQQRTSIPVVASIDLDGAILSESVRGHLYRILQELLTNVTRHANARHVAVSLTGDAERVELTVRDDGCGFEPNGVSTGRHMGLGIMAERARQLGARLQIESAPGSGTSVQIQILLSGTEADVATQR